MLIKQLVKFRLVSLNITIYIVLFSFLSCSNNFKNENLTIDKTKNSNDFDWLIGNWERKNDEIGKKTYEHWRKESPEIYVGEGFTLSENDTIFKENLRLIKIRDVWNLEVTGVNEFPTLFKFINHAKNTFTCENKLNEFPKIIEYSFDEKILTAKISDDENQISFLFEKNN